MTTSAERKALNEGTFRDANERIEQTAVDVIGVDDDELVPFLCECPQMECTQVALLTHVLDRNDRFVLTEKFGRAGEVHVQTDDRNNG